MKLAKPLFIIIAGLLVSLVGQLQAQVIPGPVSISGAAPVSPQLAGTTNWIQYTAVIGGASDDDCETLHPSNTIVAWGSSYGTWVTSSNNPTYWTNVFSSAGCYTNIITCTATFKGTDCDGTNYNTNTIVSVTNVIYVFSPSVYEVFVRQPFPRWPNDGYNNDPEDPLYNPAPLGYPIYDLGGVQAGHAWWELISDTPTNVVNVFAHANASKWLNTQVGYAYSTASFNFWLFILEATVAKSGPGLIETNNGTATTNAVYAIGFQAKGLINGLNHTEWRADYPGEWDTQYHNCISEVVITGKYVGIQLPLDSTPESFGFDLPPSN